MIKCTKQIKYKTTAEATNQWYLFFSKTRSPLALSTSRD